MKLNTKIIKAFYKGGFKAKGLEADDGNAYLRIKMGVFVIASIEYNEQKRGSFKELISLLETSFSGKGVVVECVHNPYLKAYLEKIGFKNFGEFHYWRIL